MYKIKHLPSWTRENLRDLFILHKEYVARKVCARFFNRSENAIHSTLKKSGIYNILKRSPGARPLNNRPGNLTLHEAEQLFLTPQRDTIAIDWQPSRYEKRQENPATKVKGRKNPGATQHCREKDSKPLAYETTLEQAIKCLQKQGHKIHPNPTKAPSLAVYPYIFDGELCSTVRIIATFNELRLRKGKEPLGIIGHSN